MVVSALRSQMEHFAVIMVSIVVLFPACTFYLYSSDLKVLSSTGPCCEERDSAYVGL
jgi:hypothetical protein